MNEEVWKILDNFLNYEISSYGNLRNKTTNNTFNPCIKSPRSKLNPRRFTRL